MPNAPLTETPRLSVPLGSGENIASQSHYVIEKRLLMTLHYPFFRPIIHSLLEDDA
jgi:hypothetical protein